MIPVPNGMMPYPQMYGLWPTQGGWGMVLRWDPTFMDRLFRSVKTVVQTTSLTVRGNDALTF